MGWIDKDYNLYIGSDWKIYSKDLSYAFYNMESVTDIIFENLDLSENTNLNYTFYNNNNLIRLDLSKFDTSNVTNIEYMFDGCTNLANLNISNATFEQITMYSNMFQGVANNINVIVKDENASSFISLRLNEASISEGKTNIYGS